MKIVSLMARCALGASLALGMIGAASATPVSQSVALNDTVSGLGTGPYATVVLSQFSDHVSFTVTPAGGFAFANTGGPHYEFAFNTSGAFDNAAVTITGNAANYFSVVSGSSFGAAGYGSFDHAIDSTGNVGGGLSSKITAPLTFDVTKAGISLNDFIANTSGYFFVADLGKLSTGLTGNAAYNGNGTQTPAGSNGQPGQAPEPATLALFALALAATALTRKAR
jgi:hypothetical protein